MADIGEFPLDAWRRVCARCWRTQRSALLGYLPASGWPPLQQAIADHLAVARGVRCTPQQVMVLNSSMQAIDLVARTLAERHDVAWVEDPCYPNLPAALAMAGLRVVAVPVDGDGLAFERIATAADAPALICVTPSCQYPTGTTLSLARRLALLQVAARSRAWILEDDHQHEFAGRQRLPASLFALDRDARTLYSGTFSYTMFPSLRLAYVVLPQRLVDVFHAVRRQLDDHTHGFMQAALADFIASGRFAAHLRRMRPLYAARRDALVEAVARHRPLAASTTLANGMHAVIDFPARLGDVAVASRAARAGVRVLPLSRYGLGSSRRNGLLLGFAALSERRIVAGIARLARVTPVP
jgi:GntR family transcriptional regulator/MocR family aminotransferase